MTDIDWSKAPEWATHEGLPKGMQNNSRYWVGKKHYQSRRVNGVVNTYGKEYTWYFETFTDLTPRPKPAFTQSMHDNSELPSIGMGCNIIITDKGSHKYFDNSVITYISSEVICFKGVWGEMALPLERVKFKPLTPPIELIDGNWYLVKKDWGSKEERVLHRNKGLWFYDSSEYPDMAEGKYIVISLLTPEVK